MKKAQTTNAEIEAAGQALAAYREAMHCHDTDLIDTTELIKGLLVNLSARRAGNYNVDEAINQAVVFAYEELDTRLLTVTRNEDDSFWCDKLNCILIEEE